MKWQLVQARGLSSSLIGWFGGGGYSHIDVITPSGLLRGARSDVIGGAPAGYHDRTPNYDNWIRQTVFELPTSAEQDKKYWEFSDRQIGKPYDRRGILGFALGQRDWKSPDSWFCSEQVQINCQYAYILFPLFENCNRVDPGDIAFQFSALQAKRTEMIPLNWM
jgi:hypothetical protein